MKDLNEKKFLARMARNSGHPDLELEKSIALEEQLLNKMFRKPKPPMYEAVPILKEEIPVEIPKPADTNIVPEKSDLITQAANAISKPNFLKPQIPDLQAKEIDGIKKTIAEMMQKISTMSWGSGGTGVVRFVDLDDHQNPRDIKYLTFNPAGPDLVPPESNAIGWNPTEECLDVYQPDGTTLQVGLENYIRVRNHTGNTLYQGTMVQFAGVNGLANPMAAPALANTTYNPLYSIGVLTQDIEDNEIGRATTFGKVKSLNTTGSQYGETWNIGDILYISSGYPGGLTKDAPTAPNVATVVAAVTKIGTTDGEILVRPTITPRLYYASLSSANTQPLANASTAYVVQFNTINFASGHRYGSNNEIISDYHGLFKYDVNYNITSSNAARAYVYMWIRKNGIDQPNSSLKFSIESNGGEAVPHASYILSMQPGDWAQLMIAADKTSISLAASAATAFSPTSPAALLKISQINQ